MISFRNTNACVVQNSTYHNLSKSCKIHTTIKHREAIRTFKPVSGIVTILNYFISHLPKGGKSKIEHFHSIRHFNFSKTVFILKLYIQISYSWPALLHSSCNGMLRSVRYTTGHSADPRYIVSMEAKPDNRVMKSAQGYLHVSVSYIVTFVSLLKLETKNKPELSTYVYIYTKQISHT